MLPWQNNYENKKIKTSTFYKQDLPLSMLSHVLSQELVPDEFPFESLKKKVSTSQTTCVQRCLVLQCHHSVKHNQNRIQTK